MVVILQRLYPSQEAVDSSLLVPDSEQNQAKRDRGSAYQERLPPGPESAPPAPRLFVARSLV
jgi:hypothetical protein